MALPTLALEAALLYAPGGVCPLWSSSSFAASTGLPAAATPWAALQFINGCRRVGGRENKELTLSVDFGRKAGRSKVGTDGLNAGRGFSQSGVRAAVPCLVAPVGALRALKTD